MKSFLDKYQVPIVGILLCMTLFWGSFLRLYKLGNQSLWIDEGYTINAAQGVLAHGHPLLDSGQEYTPHRLSIYLTAASMKIFGFDPMNPWSARLPHALFGIISIYLIYRAMYSITKNLWASVFAAICFAFFPWEIAWSRQVRGYAEMQTFLIAAFMYMWAWVKTKKIKSYVLSIIMFVLAYLGQGVAVVGLPLIIAVPIIVWMYEGVISKRLFLREIILSILAALAIGIIAYRTWAPHIEALGYEKTYLSFFVGTFFYFLIVGWIGMLLTMKNKTSDFLGFLLPTLFTLIPGVIIMWYSPVLQFRYLLVISPFLFLYFANGVSEIFKFLKNRGDKFLTITCLIIICFFGIKMIYVIPLASYPLEQGSPQPDFKSAYKLIVATKTPDSLVIAPYTQMTKIYMNQPGLWLPVSLTGRKDEVAQKTIDGTKDYYTGALKIQNDTDLNQIVSTGRGYIIVDAMARGRLDESTIAIIENNPHSTKVYDTGSGPDRLQVFHFN